MASFSFGEIQTSGYSGQGIQHPAAKQVLKSMAYGVCVPPPSAG